MLVADQELDANSTCQLKSGEALNMLQPLHAMIDEEIQKEASDFSPSLEDKCEDNCHCGIYSDLAIDTKLKDNLYKKAQSMDKKQLRTCGLNTSKWFCKSSLLRTLKSEMLLSSPNEL